MKKILCIDGGGIRGIVAARILEELESIFGPDFCKRFDIIAGTSTGALIALGLARPNPMTALELKKLYKAEAPRIFPKAKPSEWLPLTIVKGCIRTNSYSSDGLLNLLKEKFGELKLEEATQRVLAVAYNLSLAKGFLFDSRDPKTSKLTFSAAALASTAAPSYFPPQQHNGTETCLVDGGVFANNPALLALLQLPAEERSTALIVSIGTGSSAESKINTFTKVRKWLQAKWLHSIVSIVFDASSEYTDLVLSSLLPNNYFRFQLDTLSEQLKPLDNTNIQILEKLELLAESYVGKSEFQRKVDELKVALERRELPPPLNGEGDTKQGRANSSILSSDQTHKVKDDESLPIWRKWEWIKDGVEERTLSSTSTRAEVHTLAQLRRTQLDALIEAMGKSLATYDDVEAFFSLVARHEETGRLRFLLERADSRYQTSRSDVRESKQDEYLEQLNARLEEAKVERDRLEYRLAPMIPIYEEIRELYGKMKKEREEQKIAIGLEKQRQVFDEDRLNFANEFEAKRNDGDSLDYLLNRVTAYLERVPRLKTDSGWQELRDSINSTIQTLK